MIRLKTIYVLLLITLNVFSGNKYLRYKFDKNKVVFGDSVLLSWEAPKRYKVEISGIDSVFENTGSIKILSQEKERLIITATKGKNKITRRTRTIKIIYPQLNFFIATRNPKKPEEIIIQWNTENYKYVSIDRVGSQLSPAGTAVINEADQVKLAMKLENFLGETMVRYVNVPKDYSKKRDYIKNWVPIASDDSIPFYMEIISVNVSKFPDQIEIKVIVYDTLGNYVSGLAPPYSSNEEASNYFRKVFVKSHFGERPVNFKVREIREQEKNKADVAFVMDHSGSMNEVIDNFKDIASYFVTHKTEEDRISLVVFDHRIYKLNDLTKDTNVLIQLIKENKYLLGGSTALYAACDEGLQSIRFSDREKILVVFTDGHENSSFPYYGFRATDANSLSNKIRKTNAKLYIVGYGKNVNYEVLDELCQSSNGKFYYISDFDDLKKVLFEIGFLMKSYYSITFKPPITNGLADVKLIYRNFDSDMIVEDSYYIGNIEHIVEKETNTITSVQKDTIKMVFPPQVIANFQYNKTFIEEQYKKPLDSYAQYLIQNPDVKVIISGHSDSRGKEHLRQRISQKRAEIVSEYFIKKGVNPKQIKTEYYSFSRPLHAVEHQEWQARENRRVEIIMYTHN